MKTNIFTILMTCFLITSVFSQSSVNDYKYVIVPNKYDFLKENDQYQLNSLSKFLFEKYGFTALMQGSDYPQDLNRNRCLAMYADVFKDSGMFTTKLKIILNDCNDKLIYESEIGTSRDKEYKVAYTKALRNAFESLETLNYAYAPSDKALAMTATAGEAASESEEIKELKQQIQQLESEKNQGVVSSPGTSPSGAAIAVPAAAVTTAAVVNESKAPTSSETKGFNKVLYAQAIENGYQLVDSTPKVLYKVRKTNLKDVFLVEGKSAIVFKKGDNWVVEFYENNILRQEVLNIKF